MSLWDEFAVSASDRSKVIEAVGILREVQFFNILKSIATVDRYQYIGSAHPTENAALLAAENAGAMKIIDVLENIDKKLEKKKDVNVPIDFGALTLALKQGKITQEEYDRIKQQ